MEVVVYHTYSASTERLPRLRLKRCMCDKQLLPWSKKRAFNFTPQVTGRAPALYSTRPFKGKFRKPLDKLTLLVLVWLRFVFLQDFPVRKTSHFKKGIAIRGESWVLIEGNPAVVMLFFMCMKSLTPIINLVKSHNNYLPVFLPAHSFFEANLSGK